MDGGTGREKWRGADARASRFRRPSRVGRSSAWARVDASRRVIGVNLKRGKPRCQAREYTLPEPGDDGHCGCRNDKGCPANRTSRRVTGGPALDTNETPHEGHPHGAGVEDRGEGGLRVGEPSAHGDAELTRGLLAATVGHSRGEGEGPASRGSSGDPARGGGQRQARR